MFIGAISLESLDFHCIMSYHLCVLAFTARVAHFDISLNFSMSMLSSGLIYKDVFISPPARIIHSPCHQLSLLLCCFTILDFILTIKKVFRTN